MYNIILQELPERVSGMSVRTDFRVMLRFEKLLDDQSLTDLQKIQKALDAFYVDPVVDQMTAWDGLLRFYRVGEENPATEGTGAPKRVLDYEQDRNRIYSAFAHAYGIRLVSERMHWYEFRTLLLGLPSDCDLTKIMGYRGADLSAIKDKTERKRMEDLQKFYKLKELNIPKTREEKEKAYLTYLDRRYAEMREDMAKQT